MLIKLADFRKHVVTSMDIGKSHGKSLTLGRVMDECHRLLDLKGLSGDFNDGYRHALRDVTAYILAELKDKP
jgi:hypothetical protein